MAKIDKLSGIEKAYREPVEVMGKGIKDGIDNVKEGATSYQRKVQEGRTSEENFALNIVSGIIGFIGLILLINGNFVFGLIILIIAYIISVLPTKRDR